MLLNLDINSITKPVIKEANRGSFIRRFLTKKIEVFFERSILKLNNTLDNSILKIEGTHKHVGGGFLTHTT